MKNKKYIIWGIPVFNRVTGFFLLVCLYYVVNVVTSSANSGMSGQLLAESNPLNRLMAGLIISYCLFFSFYTPKRVNDSVYKVSLLFILYITVRYFFVFMENTNYALSVVSHIFNIIYWISGLLFSVKCFSFIDKTALNKLIKILVVVVFLFLMYRMITQKAILSSEGIVAGINVAGSAYMLAPLILFVFNGKFKIIMMMACLFICVYSAKRQAVLGILIVLLFSAKDIIVSYFKQFKLWGIIVIIAVLFGGQKYIYKSVDDLINRQETIADEGGSMDSGRSDLRTAALKGYEHSNIIDKVFGGGTAISSLYIKKYYGKYNAPHCGFVEILCDYGIIGELLFIAFFFHLLRWGRHFLYLSKWQLIYFSMVLIWINFNVVSHVGNIFAIYLSLAFGYLYNDIKENEVALYKKYKL